MKIPFHSNTGDGTHCWQAALMMALSYFEPEHGFSYKELDEITGKLEGMWTWPTLGMIWLHERGYQLKVYSEFDYSAFAHDPEEYLNERCGEEVAQGQLAYSDVHVEKERAKMFAGLAIHKNKPATFAQLQKLLAEGYVLLCNVNSAALHWQPGYSAHFVVICDITAENVILHDPGLPPKENFKVSHASFMKAWAYPDEREQNVLAIKKA